MEVFAQIEIVIHIERGSLFRSCLLPQCVSFCCVSFTMGGDAVLKATGFDHVFIPDPQTSKVCVTCSAIVDFVAVANDDNDDDDGAIFRM